MREDDLLYILYTLALGNHGGCSEDDFGSIGADHVNAQNLAMLADDDLDDTVHIRSGGIGEKLASSEKLHRSIPIHAIENTQIPCGDLDSIRRLTGLDTESIASRIRVELERAVKFRIEME